MNSITVVVGIVQLVIAVIFAVLALYIGFSVFGKVTKDVDEQKELKKGNVAFGIIVAAIFIAIGIMVQSGVAGISVGISKAATLGFASVDGIIVIIVAIVQLVLGVLLAVGAIYLALSVLDRFTRELAEFEELKKGNVAVALEMAGVIIAVSLIIQSGITGITAALG
jgi:uncharacterized membrane protein YjfL (UPF0719 family)